MIDKLYNIINEQNMIITTDIITNINMEYVTFINHKDHMTNIIKSFTTTLLKEIELFDFPILQEKLLINSDNIPQKNKYICDICKIYTSYKLKGIAAHKKGCKKKFHNIIVNV
jgi:hypothetical protein